jgi:ABC-2 type transport system permease protein
MHTSFQRLRALTYKEVVQMLRDGRTLMLLFALPIIQLFLFVYAVSLTTNHLPTALVDQSLDSRSRDLVHALEASGYFDIKLVVKNEGQIIQAIDSGAAKAGIVIPPGFAEDVERGQGNVLILLDGSDSFSVQSGYSAASAIAQKYSLDLTTEEVQKAGSRGGTLAAGLQLPLSVATRVLYNPDMRDLVFVLPGLIALIIQNIIVAHSALAIVREREAGVLEQLLATPARPIEMIIAKLIPGMLVVAVDLAVVLSVGMLGFGVPFQGDAGLFAGLSLLFIISSMGLGLLISTIARNQRQAQQLTAVLNLFSMLLTGFIYPRSTMPLWTQIIGDFIPLTYYMRIVRGVITKGVGMTFLWPDALVLGLYTVLALVIAAAASKKRLD